jgi:hypothetical protein
MQVTAVNTGNVDLTGVAVTPAIGSGTCTAFNLIAGDQNGVQCTFSVPLGFAILDTESVTLSATASTTFNSAAVNAVLDGDPIVLALLVQRSVDVTKSVTQLSYKAAGEMASC